MRVTVTRRLESERRVECRDADAAGIVHFSAFFVYLEQAEHELLRAPEDIARALEALREWLEAPDQADLRRAFVGWLRQVFIPRQMPEAEVPELEDLQEVRSMLAERVKEWERQWMRKGLQEGRQEVGAEFLLRLLDRKFGPLDAGIRQRIAQADTERLLEWGERVLTAERVEDVLD